MLMMNIMLKIIVMETEKSGVFLITVRLVCFLSFLSQVILSAKVFLIDKELSVLALSVLFAVLFVLGYIYTCSKTIATRWVLITEFILSALVAGLTGLVLSLNSAQFGQYFLLSLLCGAVAAAFPTLMLLLKKIS